MKFRVLKKDGTFYVQEKCYLPDGMGSGDYEWAFIRNSWGTKRKFVLLSCADEYIKSRHNYCPEYELIKEVEI